MVVGQLRRRRLAAIALAAAAGIVAALLARSCGDDERPLTTAGGRLPAVAVLAYDATRRAEYERSAADGLAHVLYVKSPGGILASAQRTARYRALVDRIAARHALDPDVLEAIVLLESAGRRDALAGDDLRGAAGLTQILAQTGRDLLGLRVDVTASARYTRGINRGRLVRERVRRRAIVDERFDPAKALEATARYLDFARPRLGGRADLAVVSYHMGVGNLQGALAAYGAGDIPYARLYFDSTPLRHAAAWRRLTALGDDSSTYLWRLLGAQQIMRLWRDDRGELERLAMLQTSKASAEEVLHPRDETTVYDDGDAIDDAIDDGELRALEPARLAAAGLRIDPRMGELAARVDGTPARYRALRPRALAVLLELGRTVRRISGTAGPLTVTSSVRDLRYQRALATTDIEATRDYSLHTTGYAFDLARSYRDRAQARALQFVLDRLTALNLVAWVREPAAIHITVAEPG